MTPASASIKSWKGYEFGPFILGTAQLGMAYGIANTSGVPGSGEAREILACAHAGGIRCFDTAQAYGNSETVIGDFLASNGIVRSPDHLVITKLGADAFESASALEASSRVSSQRLNTASLVLLSHSADVLAEPDRTDEVFAHAKEAGLAKLTGISAYSIEQAFAGLQLHNCDIIQIPLNVLDRRPIESGLLSEARRANKLLLFRSIYLQGLLLMDPARLPDSMRFAAPLLHRWTEFCSFHQVSPQVAALTIAAQLAGEFPLIIGGESSGQVAENLRILKHARQPVFRSELVASSAELGALASDKLLDPWKWND